jgi:hypothetical protein
MVDFTFYRAWPLVGKILEELSDVAGNPYCLAKLLDNTQFMNEFRLSSAPVGASEQETDELFARAFLLQALLLRRLGIAITDELQVTQDNTCPEPILMNYAQHYTIAQLGRCFKLLAGITHNLFVLGAYRVAVAVSNRVRIQLAVRKAKPGGVFNEDATGYTAYQHELFRQLSVYFDSAEMKLYNEAPYFASFDDQTLTSYAHADRIVSVCKHGLLQVIRNEKPACPLFHDEAMRKYACQ